MAEQAVVDLTGVDPWTVCRIQNHRTLGKLPMILYRQGRLVSPTGYDHIAFYPRQKTLSVEETFSIMNARVFSSEGVHSLMGLGGYAIHLWNAYLERKEQFFREMGL